MPKPKSRKENSEIADPRFADFATDPRFRLPSKKHGRTKIDTRFSRMLTDDDFSNTAKVDRYGRKLSNSGKKKALELLYVPDQEDEEQVATNEKKVPDNETYSDDEAQLDIEIEDDDIVEEELQRAEAYDPARGGGFSSSSEEDSDEEDEEGDVEEAEFPDVQGAQGVEMGEVSSRIAVVNLDWDNIRAVDLLAVFQSFVKPGGKIHKISVFQSEFGKERMEREEMEGPPKEIFAKNQDEEEDSDEEEDDTSDEDEDEKIKKELQKEDDGQDFDGAALRQYQLERLRYYYAVIICSDNETAQNIYENTDGTEYLSSANFFDLRFIPNGTDFDDKPRDECTTVPSGYRPTEFVTDALQHSKVKLTWDQDPEEASRKDAIKRAFSGSRTEIGENDLRAYLGSDSEDDEEGLKEDEEAPKLTRKELARQKMREALGLSDEATKAPKKSTGPVGDMEITFAAGLSSKDKSESIFENKPIIEETTAERYVRKEKERKVRRKEKAKAIREGRDPNAEPTEIESEKEGADLGFDDPFFATNEVVKEKALKSIRKEERQKKRETKQAEAEAKASNRAELELLMQDTEASTQLEHFDINEIARAEKAKKKRQRTRNGKDDIEGGKRGGLQEGFEIDVQDPRFSKVHESHEFAIDMSHPRFKGTESMKKLVEEGRKRRGNEGAEEVLPKKRKERPGSVEDTQLSNLVEKVKKKTKR
jgi:hypothetical protein